MKELVFATNNPHKLEEARRIAGSRFNILSLADVGVHEDLPETCDTLRGNAFQKARRVWELTGRSCFADDTGLLVDALGGKPGVMTARFAGEGCSPDDNIDLLLKCLAGKSDRRARFVTVMAYIDADGNEICAEGSVDGSISEERMGAGGFGYDPVFVPDETGVSFASMTPDEKNSISHRARALHALISMFS